MSDLPGFADTPGPDSTPEQDADVRALLAFLRDEPLEMPPDVAARLDAVIAEERRTSAAVAGAASALDDADSAAAPLAPVTVLPVATRRRGPSMTAFKVVGGIAAAALVVVGGINLLGGGGSSTSLGTAAASSGASAAPSAAAGGTSTDTRGGGTRLTASGAAYTPALLAAQASTLAGISLGTVKAADVTAGSVTGEGSTPVPAASPVTTTQSAGGYSVAAAPTDARALESAALSADRVATCVTTLTDGDGTQAVAVDAGTWQGKPALLVILPTKGDPTSLDALVVTRDCSPSFLTFQRIPRP